MNVKKVGNVILAVKDLAKSEFVNGKKIYFAVSNNEKKIIPNFLINKNKAPYDKSDLLKGFKLVGDYLEKTILKPNSLSYPISRSNFLSIIK